MNRRRRLVLIAFAMSTAGAIGASCSFPEPTFGPVGPDSSTTDGPAIDSPGDSPVGANEDVDPTGVQKDATTLPDGGGRLEAGIDAASCCDCDNDMFTAEGGTCGKPSGDCDDLHPFIKPGSEFVASVTWDTTHAPIYDWDCNGTVSKQYNYGVSCNTLITGGCEKQGFTTDVACGASGPYVICKAPGIGLSCVVDKTETRTQGCR